MKQADTYAYAQYNGKWGKLGYRLEWVSPAHGFSR